MSNAVIVAHSILLVLLLLCIISDRLHWRV